MATQPRISSPSGHANDQEAEAGWYSSADGEGCASFAELETHAPGVAVEILVVKGRGIERVEKLLRPCKPQLDCSRGWLGGCR